MWRVAPESYSSTRSPQSSLTGVITAAATSSSSDNQSLSSMRSNSSRSDPPEARTIAQHPSESSSGVATAFADPTGFVSDFCALSDFGESLAGFSSFLGDLHSLAQ